ncbi:hypothetical protein AVEN_92275-1 [Araneus ventricosus]|uniref:Uncharacterized protein n=1 Tax=Araneus ventricosus TaxID=182803 RepID=A0A4Y2AM96_ARAVE|nr:hypothetical protein AVEN_92275-1 [Araneus ventricosus]
MLQEEFRSDNLENWKAGCRDSAVGFGPTGEPLLSLQLIVVGEMRCPRDLPNGFEFKAEFYEMRSVLSHVSKSSVFQEYFTGNIQC